MADNLVGFPADAATKFVKPGHMFWDCAHHDYSLHRFVRTDGLQRLVGCGRGSRCALAGRDRVVGFRFDVRGVGRHLT